MNGVDMPLDEDENRPLACCWLEAPTDARGEPKESSSEGVLEIAMGAGILEKFLSFDDRLFFLSH